LLLQTARGAMAKEMFTQAIEDFSKLADRYPKVVRYQQDLAGACNNLAVLLADCPEAQLRDPAKAVEAAKKAAALTKTNGDQWNTRGLSHYRNGDWKAALEAFDQSMKFRNGGDAYDWFFVAMAHWQQGDKDKARQFYNRAVDWVKKNDVKDPD